MFKPVFVTLTVLPTWWGNWKRFHTQSTHPWTVPVFVHVWVLVHILGDHQSVQAVERYNNKIIDGTDWLIAVLDIWNGCYHARQTSPLYARYFLLGPTKRINDHCSDCKVEKSVDQLPASCRDCPPLTSPWYIRYAHRATCQSFFSLGSVRMCKRKGPIQWDVF